MFYRRKVLLSLLQELGRQVEEMRLQPLLFLLGQKQQQPSYYFLPHLSGPYSFQASADLHAMIKNEHVEDNSRDWRAKEHVRYLPQLKQPDQKRVQYVVQAFGGYTREELLRYCHKYYPYYTQHCEAIKGSASDAANKEAGATISSQPTRLYTIGYEGLALEQYINRLISYDIKVLCDVRQNAFSRKFGFKKKQLQQACDAVGILYLHKKELGIPPEKRTNLTSQADYDRLFEIYKTTTLKETKTYQREVLALLEKYGSVALTCYEAAPGQCHRKPLAEEIATFPAFQYEVVHLKVDRKESGYCVK